MGIRKSQVKKKQKTFTASRISTPLVINKLLKKNFFFTVHNSKVINYNQANGAINYVAQNKAEIIDVINLLLLAKPFNF